MNERCLAECFIQTPIFELKSMNKFQKVNTVMRFLSCKIHQVPMVFALNRYWMRVLYFGFVL